MNLPHPTTLKRGDQVDGWTVLKPLGAGTYGAVFLVEKGGRRFALKFAMHRASSGDPAQTAARALRELMCLLRVGPHPHVVAIHGHGHWPDPRSGWFYIVLDYVDGYTLAGWVGRTHPTAREVVRLFVKLYDALAHLHMCGVYHRDLKVTNIMVGKDGEPVILDFSTGDYTFSDELTDSPLPPGTARYRSPEATRFFRDNKQNADARYEFKEGDDVYALGVCLYDVLTSPFPEQRHQPLVASLMPPAACDVNPRVPVPLSNAAMTLIARSPEQRPPTAEAARRILEGLAQEPGDAWKMPLHRPEEAVQAEPQAASVVRLPLRRPVEDTPARTARSRRWRVSGGLLVAALVAAVWAALAQHGPPPSQATPERPVVSAAPGRPPRAEIPEAPSANPSPQPVPPPVVSPQKEPLTVKPEPAPPNPPAAVTRKKPGQPPAASKSPSSPVMKPQLELSAALLKQCATATAAVAMALGCTGAQLRPEPADCAQEALDMMFTPRRDGGLGIFQGTAPSISIDRHRRWRESDPLIIFTDGYIESYVETARGGMPEGTILKGRLWTGTGALVGRYYEAQLPDGRNVPVCMVLGGNRAGVPLAGEEGSKPGAVVFFSSAYAFVVDRYP
ncbi:protein kinase [Pyxidicoccus fallax]|uniref:non-specific serine/threonine protein kinase n=1 Tax=Pyxidicoccus fallax TaxID=394095 RepID=A0A848LEJ1_9BACT|nr:serine/threonine-protein kinase [Pyxidicoccus fallax]NMO13888.1 protein kinase [Pyxidicoccus fallax]